MAQSVGKAPGSLVIDPTWPGPVIQVMAYGPDGLQEVEVSVEEIPGILEKWSVVWVNINGLGAESVLRRLSERGFVMAKAGCVRQEPTTWPIP